MRRSYLGRGKVVRVALKDIRRDGPVRHVLTSEQIERIKKIRETFLEVFPCTLSSAIQNFSRDMHPDSEIEVWEYMGEVYKKHAPACTTLKAREALFTSLLKTGKPPS